MHAKPFAFAAILAAVVLTGVAQNPPANPTNLGSDANGNPLRKALKTGHISNYDESKVAPYHAMVDILATEKKPAEALAYAERAKARALVDVLSTGRMDVSKAMTSKEREQESRLKTQLVTLNATISAFRFENRFASRNNAGSPRRLCFNP